jgi:arylsulfatase A-like enzyme
VAVDDRDDRERDEHRHRRDRRRDQLDGERALERELLVRLLLLDVLVADADELQLRQQSQRDHQHAPEAVVGSRQQRGQHEPPKQAEPAEPNVEGAVDQYAAGRIAPQRQAARVDASRIGSIVGRAQHRGDRSDGITFTSLVRRPNVLLVVLDAVRRDALEPYGPPAGTTPAIADLARRGCALPDAYATSSWTLPSHASMFAGLLPRRLGLGQPPDGSPQGARPAFREASRRLLTSVLAAGGYDTRGFSANLWASAQVGLDIGFERFHYAVPERGGRIEAMMGDGRRARLAWALEGLRARSDNGAGELGRALRASIAGWSGRPTFWFVNVCECHSPCLPPRPWNDLAPRERVRAAFDARRYMNFEALCLYVAGRREIPEEAMEQMRHLYARAIAYADGWIADLLDALERRGILDETLVIVTADHGENFGEHGLIGHGFAVNQELINVPLVTAGPGAPSREGAFSLAELPRVIASAAGIEAHPWTEAELPDGVAVSQYDPMGPADHPRVLAFAERWGLDEEAVGRLTAGFTAVTDGRRKVVRRNHDDLLLYDLQDDPGERAPLDPAQANGAFEGLRGALEHPALAAAPAVASDGVAEPSAEERAALERQMKLLGYL